jgi:uncharacterized protein (UPF0147 family)
MSLEEIIKTMSDLSEDYSVPSNVRRILKEALENLKNENEDLSLRIDIATSIIEKAGEDQNIGQHVRTKLWNLAIMLENLAAQNI